MAELDREKFKEYWQKTEVIREYQRTLYTFGGMKLPYVFAAEHSQFRDRTVIRKGVILLEKPHILLPRHYGGPEFREGFEHADAMPPEAVYFFRAMGLPYSHITNRPIAREQMEYGSLQSVLDRFDKKMQGEENIETGLIKGILNGQGNMCQFEFSCNGFQILTKKILHSQEVGALHFSKIVYLYDVWVLQMGRKLSFVNK